MANLKWKTPRSKTRSRRAANWRLSAVTVIECPKCHAPKRPHFICQTCGMYDGRQVITPHAEGHDHRGHSHG